MAPDGIIEAVSVKGAKGFAFGTQWHPEYKAANNPDSVKLFTAFGDAVRAHNRDRASTTFNKQTIRLSSLHSFSSCPHLLRASSRQHEEMGRNNRL